LDAELRAYNARIAARADVLAAKDALGLAVGTVREDAARRLYEKRNEEWLAVMAAPESIPAFPGAMGAGATALIACRALVDADPTALKVWKVQSLAGGSSTDGSLGAILQDSVSSATFDIVIFDTAGTIPPSGNTRMRFLDDKDCTYIAAQTAKGGLQIIAGTGTGGVMIGSSHPTGGSSNSVWRYIRGRCAIDPASTNSCAGVDHRLSSPTGGDNVWDHISLAGANDEIYDGFDNFTNRGRRLTLSYNLFYGAGAHHPSAGIVGAGTYPTCNASGSSVFRNLYSTTSHRSPQNVASQPACAEIANNFIYNWVNRLTTTEDSILVDWSRNYTDNTSTPTARWPKGGQSVNTWTDLITDGPKQCKPSGTGAIPGGEECTKIFIEKNMWVSSSGSTVEIDSTEDQWDTVCDNSGGASSDLDCGQTGGPGNGGYGENTGVDSTYYRSFTRTFGTPKFPVVEVQAALVPTTLIGTGGFSEDSISVGANGWIGCSGASLEIGTGALTGVGFVRLVDAFDSLAVNDIFTANDRALSNTLTDYSGGSLPTFTAAGPRCADADGDGMPDEWEAGNDLVDQFVADAHSDLDEDGYLAIEEYVNGSDPDVFTSALGEEGATSGPVVTFGNGRWVYQDTLIAYQQITAGGADTDSVFMPDTSQYSPTSLSPFTFIPKNIGTPARGDTVLILINDSIVGLEAKKLDSGQVDSLAGTIIGGEGEWSRCASRGICTDSLRNRDVP
jgi:hypothetical protein